MTTIYTVRIDYRGKQGAYQAARRAKAELLDITRGSGTFPGIVFAPSQRILDPALAERKRAQAMRARDPHKADRVELAAWEIYCAAFDLEMTNSQADYHDVWARYASSPGYDAVALGCYCGVWTLGTGAKVLHCHRVLVAALFVARGCRYGGELETL